jgi:acyl-CoA thioester hydrolase
MKEFVIDIQLRWADLDPNFHVRHSVYYDWGAQCRVAFLEKFDLTATVMQQLNFGPILFREECIFRKEIRSGEKLTIDLKLLKSRRDYSRWTIQHTIIKNTETIAAVITVDGAWIDTSKRKLATPPPEAANVFSQMPADETFVWVD